MRFLFYLFPLILITSCITKYDLNSAKLTFLDSVGKKSFSFIIKEDFLKKHSKSKPSALYPNTTIAELKLLKKFLYHNKYCINKEGDLSFRINSKQEKVYDITFLDVVEQSYNARPITPVTYFGQCL